MFRILIIYSLAITAITASIYYAVGQNNPASEEEIVQLLEQPVKKTDSDSSISSDDDSDAFFKNGEWGEYVTDPRYREHIARVNEGNIYSDDRVNINALGSIQANLRYGQSYYTKSKYKQFDDDKPQSRIITSGFMPEQIIQLHMDGNVGDRITVYIDHDSRKDDNRYIMNYRALYDDEVIREINVGEIDIKFNHSKYAVYDNTDAKGLGADFTIKKGNLLLKIFGSIARGETAVEYFRGNSSPGETTVLDYQYIRGTYYQLEPFVRYDGVSGMPDPYNNPNDYVTITSDLSPPRDPNNYTLNPVNISPSGFEIYIDDQNPYSNNNAIILPFDGGSYTRMVNGSDYTINFNTGVIQFLRIIPENARIFVAYKRTGGMSTSDPCAFSPGPGTFADRIFVFIKYGYSIQGTVINGKTLLDVYEIRSVYSLGAKNIIAADFSLIFYEENQIMQRTDIANLGKYRLDLVGGTVSFYTREPFKALLKSNASKIYNEIKITDAYLYSKYKMSSAYYSEARVFKLKHGNLIENSVRIKVDETDLSASLYSVDHEFGFVSFSNFDFPVISSDTRIEIKYEYLPFGSMAEQFIGGMRADYDINKSLRVGGSVLFSRDGRMDVIPDAGQEGGQTLMLEGDASLKLTPGRIADLYNLFASKKKKSIPVEFSAYGEYARNYTDPNTFGKALIDNMEKSDEIIVISLSEKDWQLSSMPASYAQNNRGILNYYYYRSLNSLETLRGDEFNPHTIPYSTKPGPYNIAMGHITDKNILEQSQQVSLVFNFDFSANPAEEVVAVVTRRLTETAIDLSGMQYIEAWVKFDEAPLGAASVDLFMDIGTVNEDSDGCGITPKPHTEDKNRNGYIDSNPSTGYSEDIGYDFHGNHPTVVGGGPRLNSTTMGDGVLNTEDLNGNGVLDTVDNVYTVPLGTINALPGQWQKIKIHINWSTLTAPQILMLQQTTSVRLWLKKVGTNNKGRVAISSLKIVSAKWKNPELNGGPIPSTNPEAIKVSLMNSIDDSDYRNESFLFRETGVYKSLYGSKSVDDINSVSETALQIEYKVLAQGDYVSIQRKFTKELDISFYKTLHIWLNVREPVSNGSKDIRFRIGSSENDYIEYSVNPDFPLIWRELKLKLSENSSGNIGGLITGKPDLKRIKYIKVIIYGTETSVTSGQFWLNEIYVSEPDKFQGDAYWYELELKALQPLFKTDGGVPILSDMNLRYIYKGHSSQFNTINKTVSNIKENYNELFASTNILPGWNVNMNYINELSSTDSFNEDVFDMKRGDARRDYLIFNSIISPQGNNPYITVSYSIDRNENSREATAATAAAGDPSGIGYIEDKMRVVHSPTVLYRQTFSNFLFGDLLVRMMLDMSFYHDRINRSSLIADNTALSASIPLQEAEKTQSSNVNIEMEYSNSLFFLRPRVSTSQSEIVQLKGTDKYNEIGVVNDINGNFHLPYFGGDDSRLLERINGANISIGSRGFKYLSPEYSSDINYQENDFKDYIDDQPIDQGFNRYKNSMANLITGIKLPIHLGKIKFLESIKHFQINYTRSVYFDEKDVPFESEAAGLFNERYGVSNVLSHLSSQVYDLWGKYPGYYFKGRGNAGTGRDLVYKTLNDDQLIQGIYNSNEYNNSLKLMDGFTTDLSMDAGIVDVSCFWNMNQVCERRNIFGIPNQVIIMDTGINFEFDLLKIFKIDFLKSDSGEGSSYYSSLMNIGLNVSDNMLITYNINEKRISPSCGIVFKWNRNSIGFKYEYEYRVKTNKEYISLNLEEGDKDWIYLTNMEGNSKFIEKDFGHRFTSTFETDVVWLYNIFSNLHQLTNTPLFSVEYRMEINRYDYYRIVSPEPYDLFMLTSKLTLDLHKNIQGGISGSLAIENFRNRVDNSLSMENRVDNSINRGIFSYEIAGNISFIF